MVFSLCHLHQLIVNDFDCVCSLPVYNFPFERLGHGVYRVLDELEIGRDRRDIPSELTVGEKMCWRNFCISARSSLLSISKTFRCTVFSPAFLRRTSSPFFNPMFVKFWEKDQRDEIVFILLLQKFVGSKILLLSLELI